MPDIINVINATVYLVLQMFRQLHNAYVDMLCNPFYIPGESITSRLTIVQLCIALLHIQCYIDLLADIRFIIGWLTDINSWLAG